MRRTVGITVGGEQDCVRLDASCREESIIIWYQERVRQSHMENGSWKVNVETEGKYRIALCRWPREAGGTLRSGLPPYEPVDKTFLKEVTTEEAGPVPESRPYAELGSQYPEGKALPIGKARLRVGGFDETHTVRDEEEAVFELALPVGRVHIESWFYDEQGKELGGAYYAYVEKLLR